MSTTSTTHPVTPEELMALLDGELSADRAQSVSAHTESCAACQQTFASLLHTARSLTSWTVGQAPPPIAKRVLRGSAENADSFRRIGRRNLFALPGRARKRWMFGLAGVSVVLLFLVFASTRRAGHRYKSVLYAPQAAPSRSVSESVDGNLEAAARRELEAQNSDADQWAFAESRKTPAKPVSMQQAGSPWSTTSLPKSKLQTGPMIARTVSLAILVKDFDAARKSLDTILLRYNGYSANLTVNTPQGAARSLQASLRIPALQLPAALAGLKSLGHVENESQNGEEVTPQHADLVARLKNSRETEQRLQAILTQRTGKISDVLEVEQEIARVRGEIEQMEAEQKNLEHRVDFATIDLNLSEEYKAKLDSAAPSLSTRLHNALVNGYRNVADTLVALLLFFAEYGPILLFWALVFLTPAWLLWRRWRQTIPAM